MGTSEHRASQRRSKTDLTTRGARCCCGAGLTHPNGSCLCPQSWLDGRAADGACGLGHFVTGPRVAGPAGGWGFHAKMSPLDTQCPPPACDGATSLLPLLGSGQCRRALQALLTPANSADSGQLWGREALG